MGIPLTTRIWFADLNQPTPASVLPSISTDTDDKYIAHKILILTAISDTLSFLHCALFSPPISTLIATVKNNLLITSPGLSTKKHQKYLALSTAIAKVHLDKQRQNSKSTQFKYSIPTESHYKLEFPKMTGIRTNKVYVSLVEIVKTSGTIFTNVTRNFPITSNCSYKYMLLYTVATLVTSMPSPSNSAQDPK